MIAWEVAIRSASWLRRLREWVDFSLLLLSIRHMELIQIATPPLAHDDLAALARATQGLAAKSLSMELASAVGV